MVWLRKYTEYAFKITVSPNFLSRNTNCYHVCQSCCQTIWYKLLFNEMYSKQASHPRLTDMSTI